MMHVALYFELQTLQKLRIPRHLPHVSVLVSDEVTKELQIPLAVKKGTPVTSEEARKMNPDEDIWVCKDEQREFVSTFVDPRSGVLT